MGWLQMSKQGLRRVEVLTEVLAGPAHDGVGGWRVLCELETRAAAGGEIP